MNNNIFKFKVNDFTNYYHLKYFNIRYAQCRGGTYKIIVYRIYTT